MKDGVPGYNSSSTTGTGAGLAGAGATSGIGREGTQVPGYSTQSHGTNVSNTTDQLRDTHLGGSSTTGHNVPRQPYDPYSSKGQQIAANAADERSGYGASQGRAEAGDIGSRNHGITGESDVRRSPHGGVTNQVSDLKTGPHSHLENRDAVPTAGGQKVGSGGSSIPGGYDSYESHPQHGQTGQHHYDRDAAIAGGAGAAGVGGYEASKHHGDGPASKTVGPHDRNIANILDPRVQPDRQNLQYMDSKDHNNTTSQGLGRDNDNSHLGRAAAIAGGTGADLGAASSGHHTSGSHHPSSTTTTTSRSANEPHVSYMNRPSADTPLTQSSDFNSRHPTSSTGTGAYDSPTSSNKDHHYGRDAALAGGAGALGAGAVHHHNQHQGTGQHGVERGDLNPSHNTSGAGIGGGPFTAGGPANQPTSGAARAKGMGGAYEAGYEAGYRDALEHVKTGQHH